MGQRGEMKVPDLVPLVTRHLQALRSSPDYQRLLAAVTRTCRVKGSLPEDNLARVADAVLRPIAADLSSCSPGNAVVIFHMLVTCAEA